MPSSATCDLHKNKVVGGEIGNICVIQIVDANILSAVVDNRFSDQIASTIDAL